MDEIGFLNKKLTIEELDRFLAKLMNCSARRLEHPSILTDIEIIDKEGDFIPYYDLIGYKDITIVHNVLFLKEKLDEKRGYLRGKHTVQQSIKQALGID